MNIIIPLGCLGKIFKTDGYIKPKPLINIFGKQMICYLIDNLYLNDNDNLIIIYNKELNNYDFNTILKNKYKNIQLIELNKETNGPVETILYGINNIDSILLSNKCVLFDCDTFYNINILDICRNINDNTVFCFKDNQEDPIFSYTEFDKNTNNIINIEEKIKISEYANSGCYFFKNGFLLKTHATKLIDLNNKCYISHLVKYMIDDKNIFKSHLLNLEDFNCVGTPIQLKIFCSSFLNNSEIKKFCFDLDSILLLLPEVIDDYTTVKPNQKNIDYLQYLKKLGHCIIIYTSRSMNKFNGNIGKMNKDICKLTFDTLEKFNIPYDEIYFGKPSADFYIDDNSINTYNDLEKQTGFYKTSVSERDFNEIINDKMDIIIKKSDNNKLQGEIHYYLNIPLKLKKYFPIFINYGSNWYSLEKIKGITMSYLFVNESLSDKLFMDYLKIFHKIHSIQIDQSSSININIYDNYVNKIIERYKNYDYSKFINSNDIYNKLIEYFTIYEKEDKGIKGIIHGDAVFSNCLIDENNFFKLIDMRGKSNNSLTIYGDILYDYSKIYQSLIGYDEILLNKNISNDYRKNLVNIFLNFIKDNIGEQYIEIIQMITNSLLFTLIPLHNNDKCKDFYKLITIL